MRKMLTRLALLLALTSAAVSPLAPAGPARAQTGAEVLHVTAPQVTINPCNGEIIDYEVRALVISYFHTDADGNLHVRLHTHNKGSGVGRETGTKYQLNEITQNISYVDHAGGETPGCGVAFTDTVDVVFTAQGRGTDFKIHGLSHLTVNANCEATSSITEISAECIQ